jgi:type II secretory pathway component PulF
MYSLALSRFCVAMRATLDTSLDLEESLDLALRATGNAAFVAATEEVKRGVRGGDGIAETLARTHLFDADFQVVLATAEEAGSLPEVMRRQAKYFEEISGQRLALLMRALAFAIWACVAILIIIAIFRIFSVYLAAIGG